MFKSKLKLYIRSLKKYIISSHSRCHSDDPLISGALADKQNEFEAFPSIEPTSSSSVFNKPRSRKSGNIKIRFHHQAHPQEYLEHYAATQNQTRSHCESIPQISSSSKCKSSRKSRVRVPITTATATTSLNRDRTIQMWPEHVAEPLEGKKSDTVNNNQTKIVSNQSNSTSKISTQDLPYMGEITLDNFKPRRGRKPKKADICHLIYKNYGTVCQKPDDDDPVSSITSPSNQKSINTSSKKQLNGNSKMNDELNEQNELNAEVKSGTEEPLNLCVRDRYDCDIMTVISSEDTNECDKINDFKTELDITDDSLFSRNFKMSLPNFQAALLENKVLGSDLNCSNNEIDDTSITNYNNWANSSGLLLNPSMALYLQKIALNGSTETTEPIAESLSQTKSPLIDQLDGGNNIDTALVKKLLIPKKMSQLLGKNNLSTRKAPTKIPPKNQSNNSNVTKTPKRKRSAIFIPPLPDETSTNHATEVSICKFKFTGGPKPSLQEKKMLSVDAGGNFRFYSGTGDKSIRGYEFFPRESLQQSSLSTFSNAGAFLNTPGQKLNDLPPPSFGINNGLLQLASKPTSPSAMTTLQPTVQLTNPQNNHRKRKSKRSVQLQKLEKTFKEKGFLIQTQQLEQAEGTYCKFRQLKKYSRYLFRSWKDYLPGELQQNQNNQLSMNPFTENDSNNMEPL